MKFGPTGVVQTISEAYLAEGYEPEVVKFWDLLAAIARGQRSGALSAIGRRGERLTLELERRRTGRDPVWRSIECNSDGYDVLSVVSRANLARVQIEVKTTTLGLRGAMHLTRNEWDQTELMPNHTLHLWDLRDENSPKLAIVPRIDAVPHVPADRGSGRWTEVEIAFCAFKGQFRDPAEFLCDASGELSAIHA